MTIPNEPAALDARLRFQRGGFALDVALTVRPGETLVLLGPNGAGKTTCLELLAGLESPGQGVITLGDTVLVDTTRGIDLAPELRRIGYVLQEFALFPHLTVRRNVEYGPKARGLEAAIRQRRVEDVLDRFDLQGLADRDVSELSGGQRQRVALARALASDPALLLLDEPFAALDAARRGALRTELRAALQASGLPAVVVTHDPLDAAVVGDRLAVLDGGRVVQEGSREELLAHPRVPFVAELVGLNVYEAELSPGAGLKSARVGPVVLHVLADDLAGRVHLAFAPSAVSLTSRSPEGSVRNAVRARVVDRFRLPDRWRVTLEAGGVGMTAEVTLEAAADVSLDPGADIWALVKATSIQVYP
jgi:molybdate transport system ATP-binding protein